MELDPIFAVESQSETDLWAIIFDDINEFDIRKTKQYLNTEGIIDSEELNKLLP